MKYQIVSLDLDGTLLDGQMRISEENRRALSRLAKRGVLFAINSGRTLSEIPEDVRSLPDIRYIIHSDGAVIYDKLLNRRYTACLSSELSARVLSLLFSYRASVSARYGGLSFVRLEEHSEAGYIPYRVGQFYRRHLYETNLPTPDFENYCYRLGELEMLCAFFADDGELAACSEQLLALGGLQLASSVLHNVEIFSSEAGKGTALLRLADMLGVDAAATVAVGDTTNDSDAIRKAGLGLAMENAVPELKAIANGIACHHEAHIVPYLERHLFAEDA